MSSDSEQPKRVPETNGRRIVREARLADSMSIQQILGEANLSVLKTNDPQGTAANQTSSNHRHVCELDGEVVAVLQWRLIGPEAEISDVAVDAGHRRQGIASLLLQSVLGLARRRGAKEIFLEVRESNTAAIALYAKFGFSVTGRRANYYHHPSEAALVLSLNLTG